MVRFRHFRSTYGAFQPLPRLLEASKRFSLRVGGSTSHRLPGSSGPVAVYRLSSLEAKAGASNLVPRFKKADSQTPVQDGEGAFSLECYDAALQNGEVDVCWEQILRYYGRKTLEGLSLLQERELIKKGSHMYLNVNVDVDLGGMMYICHMG